MMAPSTTIPARGRLFSQAQVSRIAGKNPRTVRKKIKEMGLRYRRDPGRVGLMLGQGQIKRLCKALGVDEPDWDAAD